MTNVKPHALRPTACAAVAAVVLAAIAVLCFAPAKAYAGVVFASDTDWVVAPNSDDNVHSGQFIDFEDSETGEWLTDVSVTNVKSSNKKVATASAGSGFIQVEYGIKTGKTTISCVVNGVPLSHTFTVKYTCPAKTFKVAGKSLMKKFKKKNLVIDKKSVKKKKVVVKAKKDWVITKADIASKAKYKTKEFAGKKKYSVKITTKLPYDGICLTFKNTKTGEEQTMTYRKGYDSQYTPVAG